MMAEEEQTSALILQRNSHAERSANESEDHQSSSSKGQSLSLAERSVEEIDC
jgi:hypothetical protein